MIFKVLHANLRKLHYHFFASIVNLIFTRD